jgi:Histidine kinase-, DNA gyrase B-, and HSP90-like ATPase
MTNSRYGSVSTQPVKRFFVDMLTRDIAVQDAILDLLDNCVDGTLRSNTTAANSDKPYEGFWAKITLDKEHFRIEDNCGGIPWSEHDRAFRMGRPKSPPKEPGSKDVLSVGVYGIGMKRAIFKIGTEARIWTQNNSDNYRVPISSNWMNDEDEWNLDVISSEETMPEDGTIITINTLHPSIAEQFSADIFKEDLLKKIATHYSIIINKGFKVEMNGREAISDPIKLRFGQEEGDNRLPVQPYIFKSTSEEGVDVFLAIGLRDPVPGIERILEEQESVQYSSDYAGITVICNDRVVLYCNRDELTGWGTANIPRYHTQFIAISGVLEFTGDPIKLPTTTTKRGLNFASPIYQQALNRVREGLRLFVDFTNKWKTHEEEVKERMYSVPAIPYSTLRQDVRNQEVQESVEKVIKFTKTSSGLPGEQFKPRLPMPHVNTPEVRISYSRSRDAVSQLSEKLIPDFENIREKDIPQRLGEASFDFAYKNLVEDPSDPKTT